MRKHSEEYVFELIAQSLSSGGGVSLEKLRDSVCVCVLKFSSGQRHSQRFTAAGIASYHPTIALHLNHCTPVPAGKV